MHFKLKIWELNSLDVLLEKHNFTYFNLDDKSHEFILIEKLNSIRKWGIENSSQIKPTWPEENLYNYSLFETSKDYLFKSAQSLSDELVSQLLSFSRDSKESHFVLINTQKKKIPPSIEGVCFVEIQSTAFWELEKQLDFLLKRSDVKLSPTIKASFNDYCPDDLISQISLLQKLSLKYPDQIIDESMLVGELEQRKVDQFKLARLLSSKNFKGFYTLLKDLDLGADELRSAIYFLQSHMKKIYDQEFILKKTKKSKYDQTILQHQKNWNPEQVLKVMKFLSEIEHKCKTQSFDLKLQLTKSLIFV